MITGCGADVFFLCIHQATYDAYTTRRTKVRFKTVLIREDSRSVDFGDKQTNRRVTSCYDISLLFGIQAQKMHSK